MAVSDSIPHLVLAGDLRLDNRRDLGGELGLPAHPAPADADVVLAAYRRWGSGCPERLLGDFAFALWDGARRHLLCARDPFGVKPLYYHLSPRTFVAAAHPDSVLSAGGIVPQLNPLAVTDYLAGVYDDVAGTPYDGVARLPPGHVLVVGREGEHLRRFWHPDTVPELRLRSDGDYEEAFRATLSEAVAARLAPSGVGVYLSGGLDSAALTCVAQPLYEGGPLAAFSAVFDDAPASDERTYAEATSAHAGTEWHPCHPERHSPLADWEGGPGRGSAPGCDAQGAVSRVVTEGARQHGVTVLLSGFGGDSVVSHGPAYLTELVRSARVGRFAAEARAIARRHQRPLWPLARTYGVGPFVPQALRRARARARGSPRLPDQLSLLRADVVRSLGLEDRMAELSAGRPRTAREAHRRELTSGQLTYAVENSYEMDAAVGVERRYPFLDRRLAELCLSMPGDQKLRDGWTRSIMRRSLKGVLPDAVHTRVGKTDLGHAFRRSLLTADRPVLEALVTRPDSVTDWVEPAALRALWERCLTDAPPADCYTLWRVAVLAEWLARHPLTR